VPQTNLTLYQAGVYCMCIKVCNKLPKHTADSSGNKKQFIREPRHLLIDQSLYSVNKFLNYSHENEYE
jgi:hypothetical protein